MTEVDDILSHYGIKGMKWGVRKDEEGVYRAQTSAVNIDPGFHKNTRDAALEVSGLMRERYGYNIRNVKVLGPGHPEYPSTMAFVENNNNNHGRNEGTIFVQSHDLTKQMKHVEEIGWMAPGTANTKGLLTHESAHSIFHSNQTVKAGFLGPKVVGGEVKARDKAMKAALKAAEQDGLSVWGISGYAHTAGVREELEAEMFSQYHWATDPPRFVQEWGKTLHRELGVDSTPFKEVK